ncbi:MAG TPA: VOC family protein [Pyrinomonadaceae bacterium]|nr:VOC family protein [Pyrinomonadaceae bacterium]
MKAQSLVPMISVADVERSIAFYSYLGFEIGNTFACEGETKPSWAWLQSGHAQLMLAAASEPLPAKHTVLFYVYTEDVAAARASLVEAGLKPGEIATPFYAPQGEFELVDPDGYVVMITHT